MKRITRTLVGVLAAMSIVNIAKGQEQTDGLPDMSSAMLPIEPDDVPNRPQIPRPSTEPLLPLATLPAAPEAEQPYSDPVTRLFARVHDPLVERGIVFSISFTADWQKNFKGGLNTAGSDFNHLINANFTLDTAKLFKLEGGTIYFNFQQQHGEDASGDAGDFQGVSSTGADGRTQVAELWYRQSLLADKLTVQVGKVDVGGEFAYSQNAADFLNASMMFTATAEPLPTYPDAALGIAVFAKPCEHFYAGLGLFDGAGQEGIRTGENSPATAWGSPADLFAIGEAGFLWDQSGKTGRLALGMWHHTGTFDTFRGGTRDSANGFYLTFDQTLIRENPNDKEDGQGLGLFFIYDHAQESVVEIDHHLSAGLSYTGLLPHRDDDVAGIGATYVHMSDHAGFIHDGETTLEGFYKLQVTPWFAVQPDVQYVIDPAFANHDALVGSVRLTMSF